MHANLSALLQKFRSVKTAMLLPFNVPVVDEQGFKARKRAASSVCVCVYVNEEQQRDRCMQLTGVTEA